MTALADILAMEPDGEPRFTIEPPDRGDASEITRQLAFRQAMRFGAPSVLVYANTNGTHIASRTGRLKADREGRTKGAPDLTIVWQTGVGWLEFKAGRGSPSHAQIDFGNRLVDMGHRFAVVRTVDFALALVREWGCPVRPVR